MTNLSPSFCNQFAAARRAKGLTQSDLAREIGCKQSALSMFEGGRPTKLADDAVKKMAQILGISLPDPASFHAPNAFVSPEALPGFCPDCRCISNVPYLVGDRIFFRPDRTISAAGRGTRCAACGELLETHCPSCGAPLNHGACCTACGEPYVACSLPDGADLRAWVAARRAELTDLHAFG